MVAFVIGDRSAETCRLLWNKIPKEYRQCQTFSDFWDAYDNVFPMERWNCTLRQKLARDVRKTLSFSKAAYMQQLVTRWFIVEYNLAITHNQVF